MLCRMRAKVFDEQVDTEQLLLRAVIVSLLVHLFVFGTWKIGQNQGWWRGWHYPAWISRLTPKLLQPMSPKKMVLHPKPAQPSQLMFVDVDPALADAAPPKKPKYYSADNSAAANPHPKEAQNVEIKGHQKKVMKTTPDAKLQPKPLEPSPPKQMAKVQHAKPLQPTPKMVEAARTQEAKALPQKAYVPGDLVMAKPAERPQDKNGQSKTENGDQAQTQPEPVHERPRTIAEAMAQRGMLGQKTEQDGGVRRHRLDSTLDVMKTSYGNYDREFIDAVQTRWFQLLENRTVEGTGKVVVEFRLLPDGRITNMRMVENEMSDLLGVFCEEAIRDPAPYRPWPDEMRRDMGQDYRDVTFTFYYSTE